MVLASSVILLRAIPLKLAHIFRMNCLVKEIMLTIISWFHSGNIYMDTFIYIEQGTKVELKFTQIIQILTIINVNVNLKQKLKHVDLHFLKYLREKWYAK